MSWLNLNESLSNIKGQISNFANNVLAEAESEETPEASKSSNEELMRICRLQEREILELRKINEKLVGQGNEIQNGTSTTDDNWDWDTNQKPNFNATGNNSSEDLISDLKKQIKEVENEKNDLANQLELLDSENQQNILELVNIRDKLQEENNDLKEKCIQINNKNKNLTIKEDKLRKEHRELQENFEAFKNNNLNKTPEVLQEDFKDKYETILNENQKLKLESENLKKELSVLRSTSKTLEKTLEDSTKAAESQILEFSEKLKRTEAENKIIYAELQKAKESIKQFETRSLEDTENYKKLAIILETYESQVSNLKSELENLRKDNSDHRKKSDFSNLEEELNSLKIKYESLVLQKDKENKLAREDIECLQQQLEATTTEVAIQGHLSDENEAKIRNLTLELKNVQDKYDTLLLEKENLQKQIIDLTQRLEDLNLQKLLVVEEKNALENDKDQQILCLKQELENLQLDTNTTVEKDREFTNLKENFEKVSKDYETVSSHLKESKKLLLEKEDEIVNLKQQFNDSNVASQEVNRTVELDELKNNFESLKKNYEALLLEKESLHNKYVNIITEGVKNLIDSEDSELLHSCISDDPQMSDFSKQIENILKVLLDFKNKCVALEQETFQLSQEKTSILEDKNHEIEKLIQNSEILSQEVITKSDTITYYENECSELMKNNELLISKLDTLQTDGSLQTISESNEDNMLLLETQLEFANKRISELEQFAATEVSNEKKDYQELLNKFDVLQIDYDTVKIDLERCKDNLDESNRANDDLRLNLEKVRSDFENTEYQLQEACVLVDGLKEELESTKLSCKDLVEANMKLQLINNENEKLIQDLRVELNKCKDSLLMEEDNNKTLEHQLQNLTEKLQNAKMAETSLKLQLENLSRDFMASVEIKNALEDTLKNTNESIKSYEQNYAELQGKLEETVILKQELNDSVLEKNEEIQKLHEEVFSLKDKKAQEEEKNLEVNEEKVLEVNEDKVESMPETDEVKILVEEKNNLQKMINNLQATCSQHQEKITFLEHQLQELNVSRNELIAMVTTKHQESMTYHNEIQRLGQILQVEGDKYKNLEAKLQNAVSKEVLQKKDEEIEKLTDQNNFLKEKCDVLTKNLLEEQCKLGKFLDERSKPSENEINLNKKLERLQTHLVEVEEHYTQELLQAEQKNAELQAKFNEVEQREKTSSTMYTSVSIRANQQVEVLQNQLQMVTNQRDELRRKMSDAEDVNNKQAAALANLQFVLQQFQRDKEKDVHKETERIRRQVVTEKQVQEELRKEISNFKSQLEETKQGLQAAARLSDQLEHSNKQIGSLKEEVTHYQDKLSKTEEQLKNVTSQTDGKVDKSLVKNLVIGFVASNSHNSLNKDQLQVLKIIGTVLDFNQQDHDKVKLNTHPQGSWLSSLLSPQSGAASQSMSQESLSQAFIKFLENESKPRVMPSLLGSETPNPSSRSTESSKRNTPRQSPIVLSEIVLPTFADFAQNRNSSSILKDVLKDNSS